MEPYLIGSHPKTQDLVHYEPSIDALSWARREERYKKKFKSGRKHLFTEVFSWLPRETPLRQIAVLSSHPTGRDSIAGGVLISIDELVAVIREKVMACGVMAKGAIPESYPLLRTLQLSHVGYCRALLQYAPARTPQSSAA